MYTPPSVAKQSLQAHHPSAPELPAERSVRMPGGSSAGSSLGDSGGLTMGVVTCGSVCMLVLVSGSQVICREAQRVQDMGRQL